MNPSGGSFFCSKTSLTDRLHSSFKSQFSPKKLFTFNFFYAKIDINHGKKE